MLTIIIIVVILLIIFGSGSSSSSSSSSSSYSSRKSSSDDWLSKSRTNSNSSSSSSSSSSTSRGSSSSSSSRANTELGLSPSRTLNSSKVLSPSSVHTSTFTLSPNEEVKNKLRKTPAFISEVQVQFVPDYSSVTWCFRSLEERVASGNTDGIYSALKSDVQTMLDKGLWDTDMLKPDWESYLALLASNRVRVLYHFTARSNIAKIKQSKGLISWYSAERKGLSIPIAGGDTWSRKLDSHYDNADFVHLSFCDDHPMAYRLRDKDIVLLEISPIVSALVSTRFSDINAADSLHHQGPNFSDLQRVDFDATKMHYVSRESEHFKPHQAEVMVYRCVPSCLIHNLKDIETAA